MGSTQTTVYLVLLRIMPGVLSGERKMLARRIWRESRENMVLNPEAAGGTIKRLDYATQGLRMFVYFPLRQSLRVARVKYDVVVRCFEALLGTYLRAPDWHNALKRVEKLKCLHNLIVHNRLFNGGYEDQELSE